MVITCAFQCGVGVMLHARPIQLETFAQVKDLNGTVQSPISTGSGGVSDSVSITGSAAGSLGPIVWRTDSQASAEPGSSHAFSKSFVGNLTTGMSGSDYVFSYSGNPNPAYAPVYSEFGAPGASSRWTADDIYFSAPPGSGATTVTASLHLTISGILTTGVTTGIRNLNPGSVAGVYSSISLSAPGGATYGGSGDGFQRVIQSSTSAPFTQSGGFLSGAIFDGSARNSIDLPSMTFPVGVPVTLSITLETAARSSSYGFGETFALADFAHTLTLPQLGDVFAGLPAGFSVQSTELGIVDNHFSLAVPEPTEWSIAVGAGCGALAVGRRLRRGGFKA